MQEREIILWYHNRISHTHTHMHKNRVLSLVVIAAFLAPSSVIAAESSFAYPQDFILTAYYSPLPDQCCYVQGSYEADKILNGNGVQGADGTKVYAGMIAAPSTYAYGTRIALPGLGIMTVHDRGGAIQEWDHADRLDVWAGFGEEGLARALAFGVRHIRGTVYPVSSSKPGEAIDLASLPAPVMQLKPFLTAEAGLLDMHPKAGEKGLSVSELQKSLREVGYLNASTSFFGEDTKKALAKFSEDYNIHGDGSELTLEQAAYLTAASTMKKGESPVSLVQKGSTASEVQSAQRLLRFLGFYKGRTDGQYSDVVLKAILVYQQSQKLVGDATSPGAGRIGPKTRAKLTDAWKKKMVAARAEKLIAMKRVGDLLAERGKLVNVFISTGHNGASVKAVQTFLAMRGFFPEKKINGNFGSLTKEAVTKYQLAHNLIPGIKDKGAGTVGPLTLRAMHDEQIRETYQLVRASGWSSI